MTWNQGTATDHIDMLDQLIQVLTSDHLSTIAINAGGTGYTIGDVLGLDETGATATHTAAIEVVDVSAGVITEARIYYGGAYTAPPSTVTGNAATGGTGTGATFDLTFAPTGWTQTRRTQVAVSATVAAGGTGYGVGNTLTALGGVLGNGGSAATFTVATLSGSAVATVTLASAGQYEIPPTGPVAVSGGAGTGATLNVTWADKAGDTTVVLTGDAGGSNVDPVVAIRTYTGLDETGVNATHNWALFMATADSLTLPVHQLTNVSPGFNADGLGGVTTVATGDGAFVPLKDADVRDIDWWISATGRRVHCVFKVRGPSTTYYPSCTFGLLNPFGITSEMPYPAFVMGASDRVKVWFRDTLSLFGGLNDCISRANGPGFTWDPQGQWLSTKNSTISSNTTLTPTYTGNSSPNTKVWPLGFLTARTATDDVLWTAMPAGGAIDFDNSALTQTANPTTIYRTPNTAGDLFPLFPMTVNQGDSATTQYRTFGEIDGCYFFSLGGQAIGSEDRISQDGTFYKIFQSGTRAEVYSYFCIRED